MKRVAAYKRIHRRVELRRTGDVTSVVENRRVGNRARPAEGSEIANLAVDPDDGTLATHPVKGIIAAH